MADDTTTQTKGDDELTIPESLPILPLQNGVLFPELTVPLIVSRPDHIKLVDEVLVKDRLLATVAQRDADVEKPLLVDFHRAGVAAYIIKMMRTPEGQYQIYPWRLYQLRRYSSQWRRRYIQSRYTNHKRVVFHSVL